MRSWRGKSARVRSFSMSRRNQIDSCCSYGSLITSWTICFFFQAEDGIRDDLVTGVQTCALPISSASARFILPSASPNTRSPSSLSAIQASVSAVSEGANPARTRNPTPIFPVTRPPTRTSARETRWSTTLTPPRPPSLNAECGIRNAEWQGRSRSRELAPRLDGRATYSALRIPHSAFDSLHRHALREIARLVHVTAPPHRDVVRQELQRQHGQHGRQQVERLGHFDLVVGELRQSRVSFRDHGEHAAAACLHLFHVGHDLLVDRVLRREEHHRHEVIDQRDRAVLHLGRGVTLRVDVGDLLELEGPFERHREVVAAAEVQDVARPHHALGDPLHLRRLRQYPLHQLREPAEPAQDRKSTRLNSSHQINSYA